MSIAQNANAQSTHTISGNIQDAETGEALIGANIYLEHHQKGTSTNTYGYYVLEAEKDSLLITFSYLGYLNQKIKINLSKDTVLNIQLQPDNKQLREIVIQDDPLLEQFEQVQMSYEKLDIKQSKNLPALLGEVDLLKILQLKPGVQSGNEGNSGIFVRGGESDQNLFLLDEAKVYNPTHLFGYFSIFNPDAVNSIEMYKGGFPSKFGGRLSSVVDVKLREGNQHDFSGRGGVGLIASRVTLEGPIVEDKASYLISGRRTYFDLITRQLNEMYEDDEDFSQIPDYFFYDLNTKINYKINTNNHLYLSGYFGRDVFSFREDFNFDFNWGNTNATLRWNRIFNPRLFMNASFVFSDFRYTIANTLQEFSFNLNSFIQDYNYKIDFSYLLNKEHSLSFGGEFMEHDFLVGRFRGGNQDQSVSFKSGEKLKASEFGFYFNDFYQMNDRFSMDAGFRVSGFLQEDNYWNLEPRLALRYQLSPITSFKGSYSAVYQYIHLLSNSGASLPTDLWYPSTELVKPQFSRQIAGGVNFLLAEGEYLLSNELYYKWMDNMIDFADGASFFVNPDIEQELVFGRGWAYGNEIYLEKKQGKTTGWIGYTLSWSWREFPEINGGNQFPGRQDRRHDITLVLQHQISDRLTLSGNWIFGSGSVTTLPVGRFLFQDIPGSGASMIPVFQERNTFRMANYHRLDFGLVWNLQPKWGEADLTFGIYNMYSRRNPYFIYFEEEKNNQGETTRFLPKQVSLFPIIPAITYNFKF